jgi:5-methylcytosine-specific restriction endonuclease McrA
MWLNGGLFDDWYPKTTAYHVRKRNRKRNRNRNRNNLAKYIAGECFVCRLKVDRDTLQMFQWHHLNPATKLKDIGSMSLSSDAEYYRELAKCKLCCENCHRKINKKELRNDGTLPA